jgi:GT2 family glycosyltransferase
VAGRQVPWPDAPFQEVHRLARQFGKSSISYTRESPRDILFSNAASCIRRSVWEAERFTLPAAEDLEWAERVVAAGWTVVYEAATSVYHSHDESPRSQALRLIDINRVAAGEAAVRSLRQTLREAAAYLYRGSRAIVTLDAPPRRKAAHLSELVQMVSYYVVDFSRAGSTAERRRQDP